MLLLAGVAVGVYFIVRPHADNVEDRPPTVATEVTGYKIPPVITVQAFYPGANALTVAEAVAAPIEVHVSGLEQMLSMSSQSSNDGSYTLQLNFEAGTDLDKAQMLVQNRVSIAIPMLPVQVQQEGVTVRKNWPQPLMLISVVSPDGRFDEIYLSNYAAINLKDDLGRLPGVAEVAFFGRRDSQLRVLLDPDKLAARNLTANDVVTAIRQQNIQVAAEKPGTTAATKGLHFNLTVNTMGRLTEPEEFASLVLKATPEAGPVRLKDVARIEMGVDDSSNASLDGKAAVVIGIYPLPNVRPNDVTQTVRNKLKELWTHAPAGIDYVIAFDFAPVLENASATPYYLVIDVQLPDGASAERNVQVLERSTKILLKAPGVAHVQALTEHPFSFIRNCSCLVVLLDPKEKRDDGRMQIPATVQATLRNQVPEAAFRVSVPSTAEGFPLYGFPIDFVIEDQGSELLVQRAEALVEKMNRSGKFADVSLGPGQRRVPILFIDIDRTKCKALEVEMKDITDTLQVHLGGHFASNLNQFGRSWQIIVQADPQFRDRASEIQKLQVRNKENQMVPLSTVVSVREAFGPMAIERHNMYPIARITANLAAGATSAEAKALCESLAKQVLDAKQFKLVWPIR
jgi:multidrug efflux pump subunit AcrB